MDTEHLIKSNEGENITQEDILTNDMILDHIMDNAKETDIGGFDEREFAELVADLVGSFALPEWADSELFKRKYVSFVVPALKFGGFKKLSAGVTLGSLIEKSPWIGVLICAGAMVMGLYIAFPKLSPEQLEEMQAQQVREMKKRQLQKIQEELKNEEGGHE